MPTTPEAARALAEYVRTTTLGDHRNPAVNEEMERRVNAVFAALAEHEDLRARLREELTRAEEALAEAKGHHEAEAIPYLSNVVDGLRELVAA